MKRAVAFCLSFTPSLDVPHIYKVRPRDRRPWPGRVKRLQLALATRWTCGLTLTVCTVAVDAAGAGNACGHVTSTSSNALAAMSVQVKAFVPNPSSSK
jgi:hypothetical protein